MLVHIPGIEVLALQHLLYLIFCQSGQRIQSHKLPLSRWSPGIAGSAAEAGSRHCERCRCQLMDACQLLSSEGFPGTVDAYDV